jgi:DNA repair photolyase
MSIELFASEFLIHPAPLEYSGNACMHDCAYCFANIRNKKRNPDISLTCKQLMGQSNSKSLAMQLLQMGYPICISNRTDPFSKNNIRLTLTLCEYLYQRENGIFFQTKGFDGIQDAITLLDKKKNVVLYVTVTSTDNEILAKIEPGAPTIEQRIDAMKIAKKAGWSVICAINPCVEEWMPKKSLIKLEKSLSKISVKHFIFQNLKLNAIDLKVMWRRKKEAIGKTIIDRALSKKDPYFARQVERQRDRGLLSLAFGMPYPTKFFDEINATLGKCFNGNYAFYNFVSESKQKEFTLENYEKAIIGKNTDLLDIKHSHFTQYILQQNRSLWKKHDYIKNAIDLKTILKAVWNEKSFSGSPQNNGMMKLLDKKDSCGNIILGKKGDC